MTSGSVVICMVFNFSMHIYLDFFFAGIKNRKSPWVLKICSAHIFTSIKCFVKYFVDSERHFQLFVFILSQMIGEFVINKCPNTQCLSLLQ